MSRRRSPTDRIAAAAAAKAERIRNLLSQLKERQKEAESAPPIAPTVEERASERSEDAPSAVDFDFGILTREPRQDLRHFVELLDKVVSSHKCIHLALLWPHIPPRAILPWMVRKVSRGRRSPPMRTLL